MADHTGHFCMGRLGIFCRADKGNLFTGQDLRGRPKLGVTMEANALNLFSCLALLRLKQPVTGHARLVFRRKRREFFLFLVAGPALFVARFAGIKLDLLLDWSLIIRVVAGKA